MRRSLRRIGNREVSAYTEADQLFTTESLEEAKERLATAGREPSEHCFHSWVREGVRYYRVWEDKRLKESIAKAVPFGQVACILKRAEAEKIYIKAKRYKGTAIQFETEDGCLRVVAPETGEVKADISLPATGGALVFEPAGWRSRQAGHFVNVLLIRDRSVEDAYAEAEQLQG
ncbi:MAG TPA: hypothetical protein VD973_00775 [Symbiobacteriaceae bacterium]|jgi:hypothetical protein|nr:hypothetical protein [Symbiobacteriaceae bacterium]